MKANINARTLVISLHIFYIVIFYWIWRDYAFDAEMAPALQRYLFDAWSIVGIIAIVGFLANKNYARIIAILFYGAMASRLVYIMILVLKSSSQYQTSTFLGRLFMFTLFCFPMVLLAGRSTKAAEQVTAADSARGSSGAPLAKS